MPYNKYKEIGKEIAKMYIDALKENNQKKIATNKIAVEPALMYDIKNKNKDITIRKGKQQHYNVGDVLFYNSHDPSDKVMVRIKYVDFTKFRWIQQEEAVSNGFTDVFDLLDNMKKYYPDMTVDDCVTVVYFEALGQGS